MPGGYAVSGGSQGVSLFETVILTDSRSAAGKEGLSKKTCFLILNHLGIHARWLAHNDGRGRNRLSIWNTVYLTSPRLA